MRKTIVRCGSCESALALPPVPGAGTLGCPVCRTASRVWVYPALFRETAGDRGQRLLDESQASCMNHPDKQATVVCDGCGKFLCGLCDVDWNGEHLCAPCVQRRAKGGAAGRGRNAYIHYDSLALGVVLLSIITMPFFGLGGFIAPVTFYVAWRYWREPWRPVPHRRWAMVLAVLLAGLIFVTWAAFIVYAVAELL
ncbi:MAG: B-box zinc finger protein [Candidatus Hydrogenedentes bacterium]|nr:B-box zinc finger protein [Candidatus Hydrogenedentota bacterium]